MGWKYNTNSIHQPDDLEDICTMLEKESVCRYLFFDRTHMMLPGHIFSTHRIHFKGLSNHKRPLSPVFTIHSKDTGSLQDNVVITCRILSRNVPDWVPIDDEWMGRGSGTEACEFLIYYACTQTDAYRLNGDTASENVASWKIMEKCGLLMRAETEILVCQGKIL
jgi:ribosomal-protein-alanine N-acetyltransferase